MQAPWGNATDPASAVPPPAPQWGSVGQTPGASSRGRVDSGSRPYSQDPAALSGEVLARCGTARVSDEQGYLAPLVSDLYLSGITPGDATDALIIGDCGSLADVVSELVTQGGKSSVAEVVDRARLLGGPGVDQIIDAAVAEGLERNAAALSQIASTGASGAGTLAMAYFPSRAVAAGLETADSANTLYSQAKAGYGLYTFVIIGAGGGDRPNLSELLRVIETYVLAAAGAAAPHAETHTFLVGVDPTRPGRPLDEQVWDAVAAPMRRDLGVYLRRVGEDALARRMVERPGPFLVSSPEPRLLPVGTDAPRLLVDLSEVGGEYMYAVVDAYDRPVRSDALGHDAVLNAVRSRLLSLLGRAEDGAGLTDAWVFRVGGPGQGPIPVRGPGGSGAPGGRDDGEDERPNSDPGVEYQRPRIREARLRTRGFGQA